MSKLLLSMFGIWVIAMSLLFSSACGYDIHIKRSKEVALQQNLWAMRRAIDSYTADKEKAPKSIQELVDTGYLHEIPIDPLTKSNKTWVPQNTATSSGQPAENRITDIHSGAVGADTSGKPYNQY